MLCVFGSVSSFIFNQRGSPVSNMEISVMASIQPLGTIPTHAPRESATMYIRIAGPCYIPLLGPDSRRLPQNPSCRLGLKGSGGNEGKWQTHVRHRQSGKFTLLCIVHYNQGMGWRRPGKRSGVKRGLLCGINHFHSGRLVSSAGTDLITQKHQSFDTRS